MDKIADVLQNLANKLGTTAEYLWRVLVAQARVVAMYDALAIGFGMLLMLVAAIVMKWKSGNGDNFDDYAGWIVGGCIVCIVGFIFVAANVQEFVTAVWNPEYWALHEIFSKLK